MKVPRSLGPYFVSIAVGFGVCLGISISTGRREAWDSPVYFYLGIPLMALTAFALSYRDPRPLHWGLAIALGQSLALVIGGGGGGSPTLWPLAMVAMTFCSLPQFLSGWLATKIRARR